MKTLVAAWGYIEDAAAIAAWNADGVVDKPSDLLQHAFLGNI
jgi:phosphoglycolate phosphatase-like HAD superfamily hydrolase